MDKWRECEPEGSNVWIMPRPMYDCICLCVMNKGDCDVVVEIDFSESDNVSVMGRRGAEATAASSPSRVNGVSQQINYDFSEDATSTLAPPADQRKAAGSHQQHHNNDENSNNEQPLNPYTCRAEVLQRQTTIAAVFCPTTPEAPMDVAYRSSVVAMSSLAGAKEVDTGALKIIHGAAQQSSEVQEWLQRKSNK